MLYTSQDLLYIVLAFCVLWLTVLISWALYYVIMVLRMGYRIAGDMKRRVEVMDQFARRVADRFDRTANSVQIVVDTLTRVGAFLQERKTRTKRTKTAE